MPRQTRSHFINYQTGIRPAGSGPQILRDWNAKDKVQREAWTDAYLVVQRRNVATTEQWNVTANAVNVLEAQYGIVIYNVQAYQVNCDNAIERMQALCRSYIRQHDAWISFRNVEIAQPNPHDLSLAHALAAANTARANETISTNNVRNIYNRRHTPLVPVDENGYRKIKSRHYSGDRNLLLKARAPGRGIEADIAAQNPRLLNLGVGRWVAQKEFKGGMAGGHLWLQLDENDCIVDRVFRKDVNMTESEWIDPVRWEGDIRDPTTKTPFELTCNASLQRVPGPRKNVVQMREYPHRGLIDNDACTYKVYLEWCNHRDLGALMDQYARDVLPLPEPMIWYVAEVLAECGIAMEQGRQCPSLPRPVGTGWDEIVHRDMKPDNIFLRSKDPSRYPDYPTPVLADFGLAVKTSRRDPNNPRWYNVGGGTEGFKAPEQMRWIRTDNLAPINEWKLDPKTNVFGCGAILWSLVRRADPPEPEWFGTADADASLMLGDMDANYSPALKNLINLCLSFRPGDRPTFEEMFMLILQEVDRPIGTGPLDKGMRSGGASAATKAREAVHLFEDSYRLGLHSDEIVDIEDQ